MASTCNAGACTTVLNALFDPDFALPNPVQTTADGLALEPWRGARLTLGNEIDKLAGNIALRRDFAGVHYRSDSIRGLFVGEQQAIWLLRDYSRTYNERFDGFVVRKFDGERLKIKVARSNACEPAQAIRSSYVAGCKMGRTAASGSVSPQD